VSQTLSVVIPTKNAAELLTGALESVKWADELIVVDMFSTDETDEVCARYPNCRVFKRDDYIFGNVNFGFDQATTDWVMRLDTDERIPPELAEEVRAILAAPPGGVTGFEFWEQTFRLGRELEHGFGRKHFRKMMFRRGSARYPVRSEHESLETSGTWLRSEHPYLHLNYPRVADYLEKTNYYTGKDVERVVLPDRPPTTWDGARETLRAFYLYYLKWRGYKDGWVGFLDAAMRSFYQLVYWAKLRERWERERGAADAG
jgi:glycosyltransferase involved in cell wall biosynthesis